MSAALKVRVSSASFGGSFHLVAIAAYRNREYCVSPYTPSMTVTSHIHMHTPVGDLT